MIITNILLVAVLVAILVSIALIIHQNKKTRENKDLFNESISKDDLAKVENKVGDESIRLNEKMLKIEGGLTKEFLSLKGDVKKDFSLSMTQFNERLSSFDKSLNFLKESQDNFNKILGGVKQYGTLSERGLKAIVSDILPNSMFVENAKLNPETKDFVEIAIKLPSNVLLPVDSHWPQERYKDVISAYNENDKEKQKITQKMLADAMKKKASEVKEKYINPPYSTPFAYVYVPAESLYNILVNYSDSKTGLNFIQQLQKDFSVTIVGPNTLHQSIQILSMGFETLRVQKNALQIFDDLKNIQKRFSVHFNRVENVYKKLEDTMQEVNKFGTDARVLKRSIENIKDPSQTEQLIENSDLKNFENQNLKN